MKNWIYLLLVLPIIVFSCRKDTDITTTSGSGYEPPTVIVTADLTGQVVDMDGAAIPGAMVRLGNQVTVTNEAGLYQFRDLQMNAKGAYVTASKEGYFLGSDRFYPANASSNVNRIQLLRKTLAGTINGNQGGTISVAGASIDFSANSIVNPQGQVVTDEVSVYAQWLDPTAENLGDFMPGALYGVNEAGQEVMMTSLGMLAVELYDAAGTELQLAPGREATLSYPVPAALRAIAPVEIPLWYFDETDGVWIEDGKAIMEGDFYYGQVSHFTFWNVDFPYGTETVEISGCVKYEDGSSATFEQFTVEVEGQGTIIWGTTDDAGNFYGPVPAGEVLNFIFSNECGDDQTFTAGPFTEDTELTGCFILSGGDHVTVSGQVVDCAGNSVDGGVVVLTQSPWYSEVVVADEAGNFSYTYSGCTTYDVDVQAFDFGNLNSSEVTSYTISEDLDLGALAACGVVLENYLSSDVDGILLDFYDLTLGVDTIELSPDSITFETYSVLTGSGFDEDNNQHNISLYLNELALGSYTGIDVGFTYNLYDNNPTGGNGLFLYCYPPCGTVTVNITNNEGPGGFLEGDYSGTSDGWNNQQQQIFDKPVSGTFRVRIPE